MKTFICRPSKGTEHSPSYCNDSMKFDFSKIAVSTVIDCLLQNCCKYCNELFDYFILRDIDY